MSNTSEMKHLVEIWGQVEFKNKLKETDYKDVKIKDVYAQIIPKSTSTSTFGGFIDDISKSEVSHTFKIRYYSFPDLQIDNWIIYKGIRYDIKSFNQDFKNSDFVEIHTKVVYE